MKMKIEWIKKKGLKIISSELEIIRLFSLALFV